MELTQQILISLSHTHTHMECGVGKEKGTISPSSRLHEHRARSKMLLQMPPDLGGRGNPSPRGLACKILFIQTSPQNAPPSVPSMQKSQHKRKMWVPSRDASPHENGFFHVDLSICISSVQGRKKTWLRAKSSYHCVSVAPQQLIFQSVLAMVAEGQTNSQEWASLLPWRYLVLQQ